MIRMILSTSVCALLIACGPQVGDDALTGTGTDGADTGQGPGDESTSDTGGSSATTLTTTPEPMTTTTTSPPNDDDSCASGGGDCCDVNGNFCDASDFEPHVDGDFLLVFSASVAPDLPLQYIATLDVVDYDGYEAGADLSLQPLSLDQGSTTIPREPFGDPISLSATLDDGGNLFVDAGMLLAAGPTNPITGSDIEMDGVALAGQILGPDAMCGTITGDVTAPILTSLQGSTFAMIRVDTLEALPDVFPLGCR